MLTLNFNPFPALSTGRLNLRRMTADDAREVFYFRSDPGLLRYLDREPAKSMDDALQWIKMINEGIDNNHHIAWGIALKTEQPLIGSINLWNIQKEHYRAEIGYLLHTAHQGNGFMHEAMAAVLRYGFNSMGLHSVEANVNPDNHPSIRVLERSNFVREAYFKENYYHNGKFVDSAIYSLLTPAENIDPT